MFLTQLCAFLTAHHHAEWVKLMFGPHGNHVFDVAYQWALAHGFVYQR